MHGEFEAVVAHVEHCVSMGYTRYTKLTLVVISHRKTGQLGKVVHGIFGHPEEAPNASWKWENVIKHPRFLKIGQKMLVELKEMEWKGERRTSVHKIIELKEG